MKIKIQHPHTALALLMLSTFCFHLPVARAQGTAQGTPFLYRGHLDIGGSPANGTYDLAFSLFEAAQDGTATAGPVTNSLTKVSNGLFAVTLDFGPGPFTSTNYWLEINMRSNGIGAFTKQGSRRRLTPSPYAHGPQRLVSSGMQRSQPEHLLKLPVQKSVQGSAQEELPPATNFVTPVPKPGPSQSP